MSYNLSLLNTSELPNLALAANTYTNNLLGVWILMIIWIVLFFTMKPANTIKTSVAVATFITTLISSFFAIIGLVDVIVPGAMVVLLMGSVVMLMND